MADSPRIASDTPLAEVAAVVSETLQAAGIVATLSGGSAVSIYTDNHYQSKDLDFVTTALRGEVQAALAPLGFVHTGSPTLSVFEHPETEWYLEFPPAPLAFGSRYVDAAHCAILETSAGSLRIITPTHSVMDRLIAAASWNDPPSLEQATLVAIHQAASLDWDDIDEWVVDEGIASTQEVVDFYRAVDRRPPAP
jgi:hypothetical protein